MRGASDISEARLAQKTRGRKARKHHCPKKILTNLLHSFAPAVRRPFIQCKSHLIFSVKENGRRGQLSVCGTEMAYLEKSFHEMRGSRTINGVRLAPVVRYRAQRRFPHCVTYRRTNRHGRRCTAQAPVRARAYRFLRNRTDSDDADPPLSNRHRIGPRRPIGQPTDG